MTDSTIKTVLKEVRDYIVSRFGLRATPVEITSVCTALIGAFPELGDANGGIVCSNLIGHY